MTSTILILTCIKIFNMVTVLLEYIDLFSQTLPIMLALRLMLLATCYAQNYAGIIGWSLSPCSKMFCRCVCVCVCMCIHVCVHIAMCVVL